MIPCAKLLTFNFALIASAEIKQNFNFTNYFVKKFTEKQIENKCFKTFPLKFPNAVFKRLCESEHRNTNTLVSLVRHTMYVYKDILMFKLPCKISFFQFFLSLFVTKQMFRDLFIKVRT